MKYLWLLILIPTLLYGAGEVATVGGKADSAIASIMGKAGAGIGTLCGKTYNDSDCNPASNEVGDRTEYAQNYDIGSTDVYCQAATADCSGTLGYAYIYHNGTGDDKAKVWVYSRNSAAPPDSSDLKIAQSVEISSSAAEWAVSGSKLGGSVTNAQDLWICIIGGAGNFDTFRNSSAGTTYYMTITVSPRLAEVTAA